MQIVLILALFLCLVYISYEDLCFRKLDIRAGIILFIICCFNNYLYGGFWMDLLYNLMFVFILLLTLYVYFSVRDKSFKVPLKERLGIGDVVFFIAVTPLFYLNDFMLFFITGMIISILQHLVLQMFIKSKTIPLAGFLANYLLILLTLHFIFDFNRLTIIS